MNQKSVNQLTFMVVLVLINFSKTFGKAIDVVDGKLYNCIDKIIIIFC